MLTAASVEYDIRGQSDRQAADAFSVGVARSFTDAERALGDAGSLAAASPFQHW